MHEISILEGPPGRAARCAAALKKLLAAGAGLKVIFLDFDGVLNNFAFLSTGKAGMHDLDPAAIERLNTLVLRSGAKVVVSSTWRLKFSLGELRMILSKYGFQGEIIDKTPYIPFSVLAGDFTETRSTEIHTWLKNAREHVESFVVLDDLYLEGCAHCLVQTDFNSGFLDQHVEDALSILGYLAAEEEP